MRWSIWRRAVRERGTPSTKSAVARLSVEALEERLTPANQSPLAPTITEPAAGSLVSAFDVHMAATFRDPDAGDAHTATDWEIWTAGSAPQRVWAALGVTDPTAKVHIHLADGVFQGTLIGHHELAFDADYQLRARMRDSSGDSSTDWGPFATQALHTQAELQPIPGAGTWAVPQAGYKVEVFATGFQLPVNVAFVPNPGPHADDPLCYVTELYGSIKVVANDGHVATYASGLLNFNPNGQFPGSGEQGVAGVVVEPATGDLFVTLLYEAANGEHWPKVIRLHSSDGGHTAASQTTVLDMPAEPMGASHQISNITLGPDGKLYVHVGDGFYVTPAADLDSFRGKILRLNLDGSAPSDNPFYNAADGISARDYVFAYGLRNPFGGAWRAADGKHYEVENGPEVDRFAQVVPGRNFGYDGSDQSMHNFALYNWATPHAPVNLAFIQAGMMGGSRFPAGKMDHAFVSESGPTFASGPQQRGKRITEFVLDAHGNLTQGPTDFVVYNGTGKATVVGLAAGADGLYFSDLYNDASPNPVSVGANLLRVRWIGTAAPTAPGSLQAQTASTSQINLSWNDRSDNEDGFRIEQSTDGTNFTQIATVGVNQTGYAVTGLPASTTFFYRVRAFNSDLGNGPFSEIVQGATDTGQPGPPAAPTNLTATGSGAKIQLNWTAPLGANAVSYTIYRGTTSGAEGAVPYQIGITDASYTDTGLPAGTRFFYRVVAVNSFASSDPSPEANAVTAPATPQSLSAVAGNSKVTLSWSAPGGVVDNYTVYRSTTGGDAGANPYQSGITGVSFLDTAVNDGVKYHYQVQAVNTGGAGGKSNIATVTAFARPQPPGNLTARSAFNTGVAKVRLRWSAVARSTSYQVRRSLTPDGQAPRLLASGLAATSFVDTRARFDVTYYYFVKAVNAYGASVASRIVAVKPIFQARINFTTATGQAVPGYRADVGLAFGVRADGLSFGWNADNSANARNRNAIASPSELHDSFSQMQTARNPHAAWSIAVPNGTYQVRVLVGDPSAINSVYRIKVEGVLAVHFKPTPVLRWADRTVLVTVTDGMLTVTSAAGAVNNKIAALEITATSS